MKEKFLRIMITTRERIWYTLKCLEALRKYTESDYEVFLYDDRSKDNLKERYRIYGKIMDDYDRYRVSSLHILNNKTRSSHETFGKGYFWNVFGVLSSYGSNFNTFSEDKRYFDYLVLLDNDIFVMKKGWDKLLMETWQRVDKDPDLSKTVKVVTMAPGGIMGEKIDTEIDGFKVRIGCFGGSGFWMVKPSYFKEMGLLPLNYLVGHDKKHDQLSWAILEKRTNSKRYAVGVWKQLALHIGHNHSICNYLTYGPKKVKAPGDQIRADMIKSEIKKEEEIFKNMSVEDIIKKYNRREHQRW